MRWQAELTDLFNGEANYAWVRRETFTLPDTSTDLGAVRVAKRRLGIAGLRCRRERWGDTIVLRPIGWSVIVFIEPDTYDTKTAHGRGFRA
jgi:hypothetical protein